MYTLFRCLCTEEEAVEDHKAEEMLVEAEHPEDHAMVEEAEVVPVAEHESQPNLVAPMSGMTITLNLS